jgi:hypothetical protein
VLVASKAPFGREQRFVAERGQGRVQRLGELDNAAACE